MFTSCTKDKDLYDPDRDLQQFINKYQEAFIRVYGQPSPNQDWGFGSTAGSRMTRSGNTAGDYTAYPATHVYKAADGVTVIAGANMNHNEWADPDKEFGGWVVPDPLTAGQKLRVQLYFQSHPNLSYEDPRYANFFVQQVYTGGTSAPTTGNGEVTTAADGKTTCKGMTLNLLTVGQASSHINNFNGGDCTLSTDVLDNGGDVNNGPFHSDQITLMVNVDDTSCFGYHETSGSNTGASNNHNDKMALVSAATIDAWAAANGNPGEAVVDDWNRSFMGFDYEFLPESEIVENSYAELNQVPNINNIQYAWNGQKVLTLGAAPDATEAEEVDITSTFAQNVTGNDASCAYDENGKIVCSFGLYSAITFVLNDDWGAYSKLVIEFEEPSPFGGTLQCTKGAEFSAGDTQVEVELSGERWTGNYGPTISTYKGVGGTLIIKKVTLVKEASAAGNSADYYNPTYLLGDNNKISFYSRNTNMYGGIVREVTEDEMKTTQDGKTCLDLTFFQGLVADGYHPITSDLKTWVKWKAACDGYYSDWIVTLTEAKRIVEDPNVKRLRIFAEDVSATEASDFDFNDVVFDVIADFSESESVQYVTIKLWAAGGTLPLKINSVDGEGGFEVHNAFSITDVKTMINTHAKNFAKDPYKWADDVPLYEEEIKLANNASISKDNFAADVNNYVRVEVQKEKDGELTWVLLTAERGVPACKIGVPVNTPWSMERTPMAGTFPKFQEWVTTTEPVEWYKIREASRLYNPNGSTYKCAHESAH